MRLPAATVARFDTLEGRRLFVGGFQITFTGLDESSLPGITQAVTAAGARWEAILTADIPDVPRGPWGAAVDDLRIDVDASDIDGAGRVLAYDEPRYRRSINGGSNNGLPITGIISVDLADAAHPRLLDIITHEIGHVLGIGSWWSSLVTDFGAADPRFTGQNALAQYRAMMADAALMSVPVENTGNLGTRDVHWRESMFFNELMTGFYNSNVIDPLSRMSAAALIDLGWPGVNLDATQTYTPPAGNPAPTIDSLSATAAVTAPGAPFTLSLAGVDDLGRPLDNAGAGVASVRFFRESNGMPGLQGSGNITNPDVLVGVATVGANGVWQISVDAAQLPVGDYTYYAQAVDVAGAVSATASVTHVIAALPPTPLMPILDASTDSGVSSSDRVTNIARPLFRGTIASAAIGTMVDLFADGVPIGSTTIDSGSWSFVPASPLSDGVHAITAIARVGGVAGGASDALLVTIDTRAPLVVASSFEYRTRLGIEFAFDEDVSQTLDAADLVFANGTVVPRSLTIAALAARFTFSPLTLPAGDHVATLGGVTDVAGNAIGGSTVVSFFFFPGDIDRSRRVDAADLAILAQNYGRAGDATIGDIDYSGVVDFGDLVLLAQHYEAGPLVASTALVTSRVESKKRPPSIIV